MPLAKITLTVCAVLDDDATVASLTAEDVRDILLTATSRKMVPQFSAAGNFGRCDESWTGVYQVDTEEVQPETTSKPVPSPLAFRRVAA